MSAYAIPGLKYQINNNPLEVETILEAVAKYYKVTTDQILGKSRRQELVRARFMASYFLRELTTLSLKSVGAIMGGRDHTTILHAIEQISSLMDVYPEVVQESEQIREAISTAHYLRAIN